MCVHQNMHTLQLTKDHIKHLNQRTNKGRLFGLNHVRTTNNNAASFPKTDNWAAVPAPRPRRTFSAENFQPANATAIRVFCKESISKYLCNNGILLRRTKTFADYDCKQIKRKDNETSDRTALNHNKRGWRKYNAATYTCSGALILPFGKLTTWPML